MSTPKPATDWLEKQCTKLDDRMLARELGYLLDAYAALRAEIERLTQERDTARLQQAAWHRAFQGAEAMYNALADQIPSDSINADPIAVERVVTAEALATIGRQQIVDLQRQIAASQARVRELETGWVEWNGRRIPLPEYAASIRRRDRLREDGDE